jgi:hypothetical protein
VSFFFFPSTLRFLLRSGHPHPSPLEDFCFRAPSKKGVVGCVSGPREFQYLARAWTPPPNCQTMCVYVTVRLTLLDLSYRYPTAGAYTICMAIRP